MAISTTQMIGGLACGLLAGIAAQFGRLCTFSAIEDALAAGDLRRARGWAMALAVAIGGTQGLEALGILDISGHPFAQPALELGSLIIGALLFGIGMSLVGTCGFGMLVRAGCGDLRAVVSAGVLGIAAFAATGGMLSGVRLWLVEQTTVPLRAWGGSTDLALLAGERTATAAGLVLPLVLIAFALSDERFRLRPRLYLAGASMGAAICTGWLVTARLADPFSGTRPESLSFVAPVGRALLIAMGETIRHQEFAVATVAGVMAGSFLIAWHRGELRWEAFDDHYEMRRHLLGAVLMGCGGVLARGCSIGQGLSAASTLSITAPIAIVFMVVGARLGLLYLIEGRPLLDQWFNRVTGRERTARSCRPSRAPRL